VGIKSGGHYREATPGHKRAKFTGNYAEKPLNWQPFEVIYERIACQRVYIEVMPSTKPYVFLSCPNFIVRASLVATAAAVLIMASPAPPAHAGQSAQQILPERKPPVPPTKNAAPAASANPLVLPNVKVSAPASNLSAREKDLLSQAINLAKRRNWSKARSTVQLARNPLLTKIIEWAYLREPGRHVSFYDRTAFLAENPKWPQAESIRRRAEDSINDSVSPADLSAWFAVNPPLTSAGKAAYARALRAAGKADEAHALARDAWVNGFFSRDDERAFLAEFRSVLTPDDHWARVDRILYDEQTSAAERLLPYLSPARAAVARARIALIGSRPNIDGVIAAVPASVKDDSGLLYDRIKWRRARDNDIGARELVPEFASGGPRPDLWWRVRHAMARDALAGGNVTEAYNLAKHHGSSDALSVSEAEWLAGWIALRFLKDGEAALTHFEKVYDSVQTPPSLSRGAYWMGRTMEFLKRPDLAAEWYQRAATFVTTYYGQLALSRLQDETHPTLPQDPSPTAEERAAFEANELTQALRALLDVDVKDYQRAFAIALAENSGSATERHLTAEMLSQRARTDLGVVIARNAQRDKIILVRHGYPVPGYAIPGVPEKALVLAITRQESNFDVAARSAVGARGLMQLMPPTARAMARATKNQYSEDRLTREPAYNTRLGSHYLNSLIQQFNGSYIMAAAGYNAGPSRPRQWARQFGDPRDPNVDAIDWIEQIPFAETRSYVQRIMENLMIYRAVLGGTLDVQKNLEAELSRRN